MRGVLAILVAIGAVAIGVWVWRRHGQPVDQFVPLTDKRLAELLDLQRRQHHGE